MTKKPAVSSQKKQKNNKLKEQKKKLVGFQLHPENINRNGRPRKGYSISETIKDMMEAEPKVKKALAKKILKMAKQGHFPSIKLLWNYMDGMPPQKLEHAGLIGNLDLNDSPEALKTLFLTYQAALTNADDQEDE